MVRLTEDDILILIEHLTQGDNYDEAMKHFMKMAETPDVMDQSEDLPDSLKAEVESIFTSAIETANKYLKLKPESRLKDMKLFYIGAFDLVHGIFIGSGSYGAAIYFPGIAKGACSFIRPGDLQTHFFRVTALRKPLGEA